MNDQSETICALDLGSKNFKLVTGYQINGRLHTKLLNKITLNLGQEVDRTDGLIRAEKLSEVEAVLKGFTHYCQNKGISTLLAVATSAIDEMKNKEEIVGITENLGIDLEIANGQREGEIGYFAATLGKPNCLVSELGSHSCQIAWEKKNELYVHRIQAGYQHDYKTFFYGANNFQQAEEEYRRHLNHEIAQIPRINDEFIALAANSLASFVTGKDKHLISGTNIPRESFQIKIDMLKDLGDVEFEKIKLSITKPEKVLPGLVLIDHIMDMSCESKVRIAEAELPVGLIVEYFRND